MTVNYLNHVTSRPVCWLFTSSRFCMDDKKQLVLHVVGTCSAVARILSHRTERARVSAQPFCLFLSTGSYGGGEGSHSSFLGLKPSIHLYLGVKEAITLLISSAPNVCVMEEW